MGRWTSGLSGFGSAYVSIRPCSHLPCHANPFSNFSIGFLSWWLGEGGLRFYLVSLVCQWSLCHWKWRVRAYPRHSAPNCGGWGFRTWTLHAWVQQICWAPKKSSQSFPTNRENPAGQRETTPVNAGWSAHNKQLLHNAPTMYQKAHTVPGVGVCAIQKKVFSLRPGVIVQVFSAHFLQVRGWYLLINTAPVWKQPTNNKVPLVSTQECEEGRNVG